MNQVLQAPGPDFVFKHRIVGAGVLIAFAVTVLPMILGGEPPQRQQAPEPVTSEGPTKVFVSKITPIKEQQPAAGGTIKAEPSPAVLTKTQSEPTPVAAAEPANLVQQKAPAAPVEKAPPPKPAPAAPPVIDRGWVVRIGTFTQPENASRLVDLLRDKGFQPASAVIRTSKGRATRVWVGPFAKRVEAARIRSRVQQATGEKGLITAYP